MFQGKYLQTGFQLGMEKLLGFAPTRSNTNLTSDSRPKDDSEKIDPNKEAREADTLEEMERRDAARQRYQRMYWESVPEDGREPIVPASLEQARHLALHFSKLRRAKMKRLPRIKDTDTIKSPRKRVQVVTKEGRPPIMFVDVGGQFMDESR